MEIIIPAFFAALLVVSTSSSVVVGAISPGLLRLFDSSKSQSQTGNSRDDRRVDRSADRGAGQVATVKPSTQEAQPVVPAQSNANQSTTVKPEVAPAAPTASRVDTVTSTTPDTAVASKQLSSEQTKKSVQPVRYQSSKISTDQRNDLLQISLIVAGAAGMVYVVSYAGVVWRLIYGDPNSARQSIVQQ